MSNTRPGSGSNHDDDPSLSGVKNADENELRSIASEPESIHMYNVNDFSFLLDIVDDLSSNICNSVKGPGRHGNTSISELELPF